MGIWKSSKPLDSYIPQLRRLDPAFLEVSHYGTVGGLGGPSFFDSAFLEMSHYGTAGAHPSLALRRTGWLYWWLHDFDFYGRCIIEIREKRIAILFVTPPFEQREGRCTHLVGSLRENKSRAGHPAETVLSRNWHVTSGNAYGLSNASAKLPRAPNDQDEAAFG